MDVYIRKHIHIQIYVNIRIVATPQCSMLVVCIE